MLVYGLLPRLLLWLGCLALWRHGRRALRLDTSLPGYAELAGLLLPASDRLGVQDPAPAELPRFAPRRPAHAAGTERLLVGLELGEGIAWPPALALAHDGGNIASREERRALADALAARPVARLLVACDGRLSPDRGSVAFITELAGYAGQTAVWLIAAARNCTTGCTRAVHCGRRPIATPTGTQISMASAVTTTTRSSVTAPSANTRSHSEASNAARKCKAYQTLPPAIAARLR